MKEIICQIQEEIQKAEVFLIGVGSELSPKVPAFEGELAPYQISDFYQKKDVFGEYLDAYQTLLKLVGTRPYFVVTMNTDDLIFQSDICSDFIVAPCGSMQKLQCKDHIMEAAEIRGEVLEKGTTEKAVCPMCGFPLAFHTIKNPDYLEKGYLEQWGKYKQFLQRTLNKQLCVLELGVGFQYPQVVRWPFEKTVYYNKKAKLIRVNGQFAQLPEELKGKGISVPETPLNILRELKIFERV